jgi:hypothetical protein
LAYKLFLEIHVQKIKVKIAVDNVTPFFEKVPLSGQSILDGRSLAGF